MNLFASWRARKDKQLRAEREWEERNTARRESVKAMEATVDNLITSLRADKRVVAAYIYGSAGAFLAGSDENPSDFDVMFYVGEVEPRGGVIVGHKIDRQVAEQVYADWNGRRFGGLPLDVAVALNRTAFWSNKPLRRHYWRGLVDLP